VRVAESGVDAPEPVGMSLAQRGVILAIAALGYSVLFKVIKRVMFTCSEAGFSSIDFAVIEDPKRSGGN
jgi:hypothetical protein